MLEYVFCQYQESAAAKEAAPSYTRTAQAHKHTEQPEPRKWQGERLTDRSSGACNAPWLSI